MLTALRCKKIDVQMYHRKLSKKAESLLSPRPPESASRFSIGAIGISGDWKRVSSPRNGVARISFTASSTVTTTVSGRREPAYVLKLPAADVKTELGWWLSWFEEWETTADSPGEVTLRSSSLHFYCGSRYAPEPDKLVFRAEWGPFDLGLIQNGNAAHPHWHAHHEVQCRNTVGSDSLVVSLHGFHLPMGGWTHSVYEPATCWQFALPRPDPFVLHDWAVRTIGYFQSQLGEEQLRKTVES